MLPEGSEPAEVVMMAEGAIRMKPAKEGGKLSTLKLKSVDMKKKQAMLKVGEAKDLLAIGEGQSRKLDLDGDGVEDVQVTVKKLSDWNAAVTEVQNLKQ